MLETYLLAGRVDCKATEHLGQWWMDAVLDIFVMSDASLFLAHHCQL